MAFNTDVVKKTILNINIIDLNIPLYQNQIFRIPITFYNARRQQSSRTVELVDHTYDGRRVAGRTHTSVDRNALTALLRSRMGLLWTLFLQLCSSRQDFV